MISSEIIFRSPWRRLKVLGEKIHFPAITLDVLITDGGKSDSIYSQRLKV